MMNRRLQISGVLMIFSLVVVVTSGVLLVPDAQAVRIKDIADIKGVRHNQLVGYGLVVGLSTAFS